MKQPMRFSTEQKLASDVLLRGAAIATPSLSELSAWLMAGLGAAFSLFVANIDSIAKHVHSYNIRWGLLWFSGSLLLGLLARLLAVSVTSGLNSNEAFAEKMSDSINSQTRFDLPAFRSFFFSGLLLPYRCVAWWTSEMVKRGDLMASAKLTAKTSQVQALLVLCQIVCSIASVLVLASGVKF